MGGVESSGLEFEIAQGDLILLLLLLFVKLVTESLTGHFEARCQNKCRGALTRVGGSL